MVFSVRMSSRGLASVVAIGSLLGCKCGGEQKPLSAPSVSGTTALPASAPIAPATIPTVAPTVTAAPTAAVVDAGKAVKVEGTDMIGNAQFNLVEGKIYGFNGAQVTVNGNKFRVTYNSDKYSGAVHTWGESPAWNGQPIDLKPYSKLFIVVEGNASNTKVELNDSIALDYGALNSGVNVIDLAAKKKDAFAPMTDLKKINFVNNPGQGQYIIRVSIQ